METFQIYFNTFGNNVISDVSTSALRSNVTFRVNWDAILPQKYKRFKACFIFKSGMYGEPSDPIGAPNVLDLLLVDFPIVSMTGLNTRINDGMSRSDKIGILRTSMFNPSNGDNLSFYEATAIDNIPFEINYPQSSTVNISLKAFDATNISIRHWVLVLNLEAIE